MRRKRIPRILGGVAIVVAVVGISVAAFAARDRWLPWLSAEDTTAKVEEQQAPVKEAKVLKLSPQAPLTVSALHCVSNQSDGLLRLGPLRGQPPSVFEVAFPIYLRTLSLRI